MSKPFRLLAIDRHRLITDGDGVTSLIALAGCPLSCRYCINQKLLKSAKVTQVDPAKLLETVLQDYCYYAATGGGLTFGGGEPLLQAESIEALCKMLLPGIRVNIETSLQADEDALRRLVPFISEWIIDIKSTDDDIYRNYTGGSAGRMRDRLRLLAALSLQDRYRIRIPEIPGFTTPESIAESEAFCRGLGFTRIDRFTYRLPDQLRFFSASEDK